MQERTRVAILGGGIAGLTAAYELTATPELRERFHVTLYQQGWLLGGKCASGRNAELGDRIEEHGLHMWFGFYENAFALMRRCYRELDRPPSTPLATVDDAFKPRAAGILWDEYRDHWSSFTLDFPPNDRVPGDGTEIPDFWEMARRLVTFLADDWMAQHFRLADEVDEVAGDWTDAIEDRLGKVFDPLVRHGVGGLLKVAGQIVGLIRHAPHPPGVRFHHGVLRRVLHEFRENVWKYHVKPRLHDDAVRLYYTRLDTMVTLVIGIIDDAIWRVGFDGLNGEELRAWLARHGAREVTLESAMVRACYSGAFGFLTGDWHQPDMAAGVGVQWLLRQILGYKGALVYRMEAGMGDAVIAPLYEVLHRRGVEFHFFHRVTALRPSADGDTIDAFDVVRQVAVPSGRYHPLRPVNGLPCWPSEPQWDQLEDGAALQGTVDFSREDAPTAESLTRRRGEHFDEVVLAIPVAALPALTADLVRHPRGSRFAAMLAHSATCMTQAFQLWLTPESRKLGWRHGQVLSSTYVEPLDTYCDMTHLLRAEAWPASVPVGSIAYFCGACPDQEGDTAQSTAARARADAVAFVRADLPKLWPDAFRDGDFRWDLLVDPHGRDGEARFDSQYSRANFAPSERYVLSPTGSVDHRLRADGSGWSNLTLAGDWTRTGVDLGCVEATVMSGMQAARAITGEKVHIVGEDSS